MWFLFDFLAETHMKPTMILQSASAAGNAWVMGAGHLASLGGYRGNGIHLNLEWAWGLTDGTLFTEGRFSFQATVDACVEDGGGASPGF